MADKETLRFYRVRHDRPNPLEKGVVESLIEQGREPQLVNGFDGMEKSVLCVIPAGEVRKSPDVCVLTPEEGHTVEDRIAAAKENNRAVPETPSKPQEPRKDSLLSRFLGSLPLESEV